MFDICGKDLSLVVNTTEFVPRPEEGRDWVEILLDAKDSEESCSESDDSASAAGDAAAS